MENQVKDKRSVNYAFKIVGNLGHDNKLFDRTCPACRGMYSSQSTATCPKCGTELTYITNSEGKALAISEGTIYPSFGPKQEARDKGAIAKRKNGMPIKYRFKMFAFMDDHGILTPPAFHSSCLSGAKVEIVSMNHQLIPSWFMGKDNSNPNSDTKIPWVEIMINVYTNYGDTFKILTAAQYANRMVSHGVNPDGSPSEIIDDKERIAELEHQLAEMKAQKTAASFGNKVEDPVASQGDVPWYNEDQFNTSDSTVSNITMDPFTNANAK